MEKIKMKKGKKEIPSTDVFWKLPIFITELWDWMKLY